MSHTMVCLYFNIHVPHYGGLLALAQPCHTMETPPACGDMQHGFIIQSKHFTTVSTAEGTGALDAHTSTPQHIVIPESFCEGLFLKNCCQIQLLFFFTEQFLNPLHHLNHLHKPHLHHIQWHTSSTFPTCFSSLHHLHHLHLHHIHHPHGLYIFIYITYIIDMSNTIYTRSYTGVLTQDLISQELISRWSTCIFPNFSQGGKGNQVSSICV